MRFELLENRRLLSASLNPASRVLTVIGTGRPDSIGVTLDGPATLLVIDNGVNRPFPLSKVGSIVVNGRGGNDDLHAANAVTKPITLNGGGGNDKLRGGGGKDVLNGGDGNDNLDGNDGPDTFIGGRGTDVANYTARGVAVNISLDDVANDGRTGEGDNVRTDVENVFGGAADDVLTGDAAANDLRGYGGNDTLYGGAGNDRLHGGDFFDALHGGPGDDLLDGGFGGDVTFGDAGTDTVDYSGRAVGVLINLADAGPNGSYEDAITIEFDGQIIDVDQADSIYTCENAIGGSGDDTFFGNDQINVLRGFGGNDTFYTRGGKKDYLFGGAGDDTVQADATDIFDSIESFAP